jgi:NADH:ubiquinone oxidoreductase subunit
MSAVIKLLRAQFVTPYQELMKTLRHNYAKDGGYIPRFRGVFIEMCRQNEIKYGRHVGTDALGNEYFENDRYFVGRNRWVNYNKTTWKDKWDYNASQVAPEWHRWLHQMTDDPPTEVPPTPRPFIMKHKRNMTGTKDCYVPYSTTRQKIESWKPN